MRNSSYSFILIIAFLLSACSKEEPDPLNTDPLNTDPANAPCLVSKISFVQSELPGYISFTGYEYDDDNRITSELKMSIGCKYEYVYDASDRPLFRSDYNAYFQNDTVYYILEDSVQYAYSDGRIDAIDEGYHGFIDTLSTVTLNKNGQVARIENNYYPWSLDFAISSFEWVEGNLYGYHLQTSDNRYVTSEIELYYTYTDHINPLAYSSLKQVTKPHHFGHIGYSNNLVSSYEGTKTFPWYDTTLNVSGIFTYEFNEDGFPTKAILNWEDITVTQAGPLWTPGAASVGHYTNTYTFEYVSR